MAIPQDYSQGIDPERALKYGVQRVRSERAELVEGVIEDAGADWDHEHARHELRTQLSEVVDVLGCLMGSGDLDLPGSLNWYVPDIAVVPEELARDAGSLVPDQTLLIVEVTSESNAETDRVVKRKRYAEYGAPLYLLVDRLDKTVTLFAGPGRLGYTQVDGPHPFGTPVRLPEPFGIDLDTSEL
ncbi:Uma2 family endonuclease [Streptomyces sp. NBC_00091]|uniref:Uma2 family endonuclease n=1 Tax=Streptomyces sp. NBC_00091 TaxID=2975648 RepID=UPI00225293FB|nr:Uma2 family endonuclease [Streptomyces sp. NBC_00091]MCX5377315.1 Uma2 family endonuclease [Streptomyces sp. NBC_00091]